jgi:osomolarity two-component system, sensor histidine kinase TcsA
MADICEQVFTLSPIPSVILDPSLCIQRASNSFLHHTKLHADEWRGSNYLALLKDGVLTSDIDMRHVRDIIHEAIQTLEVQTGKHIHTNPARVWQVRVVPTVMDCTLLYLLVEWLPVAKREVKTGTIGNGLATSEAFRILIEAVNDYAIFLLDTKGNVVTWNAGAELIKQYKSYEIIGKHFSTFYGEEDLKANKPAKELKICLLEGRVEDEGWRYRKDGTRFWANVIITAVYDNGIHVGFGKVTRDLTERKAAESRLIAAYKESAKLKSEFLANMSHEIRTPMHGMISANTLLLDTQLTEEQRDLVTITEDSGKILLQVINNILDYSKLASGSFSLSSDIVVITSILGFVIRSFQTILKPGVHFELSSASDIPRSVQGDSLRYRQVVQNLVSNAVKFTDKGLIRIHAHLHSEDDHTYTIQTEVQDTGIGVPESATSALFTPFRQFDNSSTKSYQGTGLGLSISKSLVELMGGQIGFMPNPERHGSVFWFTAKFQKINALGEMARLTAQLARAIPVTPNPDLSTMFREVFGTKSLLLAEDNIINQKVMLRMLRSLGFMRIDTAIDGAQAIHLFNGSPKNYDLILMDISMPVVDGIAATTQLRSAGVRVPIIAITANALKGDREEFLARGMNDYVPKPVDRDLLTKILTKWLVPKTYT